MTKMITILVLLGLSVGIFVKYTKPTYKHAELTKQKVEKINEALEKARNIRNIRDKLSRRFNEFSEEKIEKLRKMIPDHVDNIKLILDMDGIASQYGMRLTDVKIDNKSSDRGATVDDAFDATASVGKIRTNSNEAKKSLSISFNVKSTYDDFLLFLNDLESSLRIVDVEKITISAESVSQGSNINQTPPDDGMDNLTLDGTRVDSGAQNTDEPLYTFTLSLRTYWLNKETD